MRNGVEKDQQDYTDLIGAFDALKKMSQGEKKLLQAINCGVVVFTWKTDICKCIC